MILDVGTVFASNLLTCLVCTLILALLWRNNRDRFAGTAFWVAGSALQTAALVMSVMSGRIIPEWIEIALFNPLVVTGLFMGYIGLERFLGKKGQHVHNYLVLALFVGVQAWFTFFQPNLTGRIINLSAMLMIISFQCTWLLFYRVDIGMRPMTRTVGIVFGAYCMVSLVRVVRNLIISAETNDFL